MCASPSNSQADSLSYDEARTFLFERIDYERKSDVPYAAKHYRLDRMRELLRRLGHPDRNLKIIHIAGSKGKGSTAAMLASMLTAAGYRTGLFCSPHLQRLEERFAIDGKPCSPEDLVELVNQIRPAVKAMDKESAAAGVYAVGPTFFEIATAITMLHFATQNVDAVVLEVGMGGRLDSTNVCHPILSIITTISLDHTEQLGSDLPSIAIEKGQIIKPRISVICGVLPPEPRTEIEKIAADRESRLLSIGADFSYKYFPPTAVDLDTQRPRIDFSCNLSPGTTWRLEKISLGLLGRHQGLNAAVALAAIGQLRELGWRISDDAAREGLHRVRCPARVEVVAQRPTVVLDAAHNVASIEALLETMDESFSPSSCESRQRLLMFAATEKKDIAGMLRLLLPAFDRVVFTRYIDNPRGVDPQRLAEIAATIQLKNGPPEMVICENPTSAWQAISSRSDPNDLICVTGSFYIAAEMQRIWNKNAALA